MCLMGKGLQDFQVKETVSAEDVIRGFRIAFSSAPVPWMAAEQLRSTKEVNKKIPHFELERSPREGHSHPLQYSCLGNSMVRGAWGATSMGSQGVRLAE